MLVLTRKPGESLYIGDDIKVTLHGIRGNQVRIGVEAPSHVRIYREEIYLQIQEENRSAAVQASSFATDDLQGIAKAWKDRGTKGIAKLGKGSELPAEKDLDAAHEGGHHEGSHEARSAGDGEEDAE